jgi:phosphoribosylformylglycinamidine (FGAM) synthase-like enzyme
VQLKEISEIRDWGLEIALFSESNGRIVVEVAPEQAEAFEALMRDLPCTLIGQTRAQTGIQLADGEVLLD